MGGWSPKAYIKASNLDILNRFGGTVALSGDGDTLAVSATNDNFDVGSAYVFKRDATGMWSEQAHIKSDAVLYDYLGGNQADDSAPGSGAFYLY